MIRLHVSILHMMDNFGGIYGVIKFFYYNSGKSNLERAHMFDKILYYPYKAIKNAEKNNKSHDLIRLQLKF